VGYLLKERVLDGIVLVDPLADLTERERETLALVAEGLSNKAIAARMFVTERTVEAHVTQIFSKLELDADRDTHRRVLAVLAYLRAIR
jgi:DNA-binding NarL/FixJ family response regulator